MNYYVILVLEYSMLVILVVGFAYIIYLFKEKDAEVKEDYYGLNFRVFHTIKNEEYNEELIKALMKIIKDNIKYVENNYLTYGSIEKENKALELTKKKIKTMGLKSKVDDESLRVIIRLGCVFMFPEKVEK